MTQNELLPLKKDSVSSLPGRVEFKDYEVIKASAQRLADSVKTVEVTEETVATNKKLRAAINKQVKELDSQRIAIKKSIMGNYDDFAAQIKEIGIIVDVANHGIDMQIKALEEVQRKEREKGIEHLFGLHVQAYENFPFTVEDFLNDNSTALNKTTSNSKVEEMVASWLDSTAKDIAAINLMADSTTIMSYYLSTHNLTDAVTLANQDNIRRKNAEAALQSHVNNEPAPEPQTVQSYTFTVPAALAPAVKQFMTDNNITFTEKENY